MVNKTLSKILAIAVFAGCATAWNFGLSKSGIKRIIDSGVDSGWNEYAWGMAIDGDVMVIGSNRYHENNSAIGMVITGSFTPEMAYLAGIEGSPFGVGTPQWGADNGARIFKCTGLLTSGPTVTCSVVKQSPMVCRPAGALCPIMRPLPAPGMCFPESYGFRTVRRIGGYWVALGIGSVVLGMPTKVFVSTTADAGSWIDVTANLDVLNPANCATGVYVQPREFTEFNGEICITSSVMAVNVAQGGFFYYKPALMCKSVATIANPSITWVDRIDGNALLGMGNRDLFYLEKFPGFMGHDQALFASINNYGYNSNISLGGYQVWYTFGDLDANNKFVWHQLIANGFGDAAAQMGMTMKYWNQHMYIGSATWMGLIMTPASQIYGVGKGFELVRVSTTGTVELIVGDPTPRLPTTAVPNTRNFPLSGLPAGFGWPFNAYAWQIESFKGWLYLGTYDAFSKFFKFGRNAVHFLEQNPALLEDLAMQAGITQMESILGAVDGAIDMSTAMGIDVGMVHEVLDGLADDAVNLFGGFDLWKSQDGRYWFPVTVSGFGSTVNSLTGNYKQVGVRRLVEANNKMYIGTASFYGDGFEVLQGKVTEY